MSIIEDGQLIDKNNPKYDTTSLEIFLDELDNIYMYNTLKSFIGFGVYNKSIIKDINLENIVYLSIRQSKLDDQDIDMIIEKGKNIKSLDVSFNPIFEIKRIGDNIESLDVRYTYILDLPKNNVKTIFNYFTPMYDESILTERILDKIIFN